MVMPSRGLASAAAVARQAVRVNRRFISTARASPVRSALQRPSSSGLLQTSSQWRAGRILPLSAVSIVSQARLASTAPNDAASASIPTPVAGPLDTATANLDSLDISKLSETYLASMPEQIGYLKEIGLDYGWGPTAMVEWLLEHIHVYSGLPWWGSIAVTAIAVRVALIPLFIKSSDVGARMQAMQPVLKPLSVKMTEALRNRQHELAQKYRAEMKAVSKAAGIKNSAMFTPMLLQGVFGFCAFKLLRAMANLPVPGLEEGGFLWVTDLTQTDPYLLLPVIMAASMHVMFRFGGESGAALSNPAMRPIFYYVMPSIIFLSTIWLPACVDLWLASAGLLGIGQAALLRRPAIRDALGLVPLAPGDPRNPSNAANNATSKTIDAKGTSRPYSSSATAGIRYQAPNIRTAGGASPEMHPQPVSQGVVEKTKSSLSEITKGLKTSWNDAKAKYGVDDGPKNKTRSKEFIRKAEAYEKKWQERNKGR